MTSLIVTLFGAGAVAATTLIMPAAEAFPKIHKCRPIPKGIECEIKPRGTIDDPAQGPIIYVGSPRERAGGGSGKKDESKPLELPRQVPPAPKSRCVPVQYPCLNTTCTTIRCQ
jgi:hypothetical protein